MGDASDENNNKPSSVQTPSKDKILEQAQKFLQDEDVKSSSRETKVDFLKSKGLEDTDITVLLSGEAEQQQPQPPHQLQQHHQQQQQRQQILETPRQPQYAELSRSSSSESQRAEHPPIITYPEFLTQPTEPPPLLTAPGLAHALGIITGASILVYSATHHLVRPLVESLTEARIDLHHTANTHLARLVCRLEDAVSELPPRYHHAAKTVEGRKRRPADKSAGELQHGDEYEGTSSHNTSYDDPSELFHCDIGVQTSTPLSSPVFPPSASSSLAVPSENHLDPINHQLHRLHRLSFHVRTLATDVVRHAEDLAETKNTLDSFGSTLHTLTYPPESFAMGSSYLYGTASNKRPEDEFQRVKTSIRSVKGILLTTRSFPAGIQ